MPAGGQSGSGIEFFLALEGIDGSSQDRHHPGEIDVETYAWGLQTSGVPGRGGGGGAGKATFEPMTILASSSKASPLLFLRAASGAHVRSAVLTARRRSGAAAQEFLRITLRDVVVSRFQQNGDHGQVYDEFALSYVQLTQTQIPQESDGSAGAVVEAGWDANKGRSL